MDDIRELLKKYNIKPLGWTKNKNIYIIDTTTNKYVLKKNSHKQEIYNYLHLRNFDFIPNIYNSNSDDTYEIQEFIDNYNLSDYEKAQELINIISLLHNKTTTYNEVDIDDYKIIYENLDNIINDLAAYYNDLNSYIDNEIYMSPSNYLLVRNISKLYATIDFCKKELDSWYLLIKNSSKQRIALINNNLELDHLIRNENKSYIVSWDQAKYDIPIYDIYKFYKNSYQNLDFDSLFTNYFSKYPLHEEEQKLLFILISLPDKIEFSDDEYNNCEKVDNLLTYIVKTEKIISQYYTNDEQEENYNLTK